MNLKETLLNILVGALTNPFSLVIIGLLSLYFGSILIVGLNDWINAQPYSTEFKYVTMILFFGGVILFYFHEHGKYVIEKYELKERLGLD